MSGLTDRLKREPGYRPHCLQCSTMERLTLEERDGRKIMVCEVKAETHQGSAPYEDARPPSPDRVREGLRCGDRGVGEAMTRVINNVLDRRNEWIGSWEVEDLDPTEMRTGDRGRTVIYIGAAGEKEAGTLVSWGNGYAFVRFHKGDTAAKTNMGHLLFGIRLIPMGRGRDE